MLLRRFLFSAFMLVGLLVLVSSLSPVALAATTYTVNTLDDNQTSGDGFCTLREAAQDHASDCGADSFSPYTVNFSVSGTITLAAQLDIPAADTTIDGTGQTIVISGGGVTRVLYRQFANTLTLQYLTIADGNCGGPCTGSGIFNNAPGMLNIFNTTFANNQCTFFCDGGAIFNVSTLNVDNSTFSNNVVDLFGGGIYNSGSFSTANVTNSTFHTNSATTRNGGAIFNFGGRLNVSNSTLTNNTALGGGAIAYEGSTGLSAVINSTIAGNSSTGIVGGSIHVSFGPNFLVLQNTILADNSGANCHADPGSVLSALSNNISDDASCDSATQQTTAQINLAALGNYGGPTKTMALLPGSTAMDAADDTVCNAPPVNNLDQRGIPRPGGTDCDVGAYEAVYGAIVINKVTDPPGLTGALFGTPQFLSVLFPLGIVSDYPASGATFGAPLDLTGIDGNLELVNDGTGTTTDGCEPLVGFTSGNIALIDRGNCQFDVKVQNAEDAGAIAAVIVNNTGNNLVVMDGTGPTIPSIFIGQTDGTTIRNDLPGVLVNLNAPLGGVFRLDDGQNDTINSVEPGQYKINEDSTGGIGVTLDNIVCDDGDSKTPSTVDIPTATATINVDPEETVTCTFTNKSSTTAVNVTGFRARLGNSNNVALKWQTTTESQIAGFEVYRKVAKGKWRKISDAFIQAKHSGTAASNAYKFKDKSGKRGKMYNYKVQVHYLDNHTEFTPVIKVKLP